ncbi:methylosome subunit pICln [Nephila pilipes]|uniref:Methylosome subunit pICln n=1 Tax=Nephila pilipes TaxID=299642 RepID=A0A8X6PDR4_NEPPI|nr:methylosome subunit pICln [Nephila pilipes]
MWRERFFCKKKLGKMVLMRNFPAPTEGVHHVQPDTRVFFESVCLGKGTLYVSESVLCWLSNDGEGFSFTYPSIRAHAITYDPKAFPEPCVFMITDEGIEQRDDPNELLNAVNDMNVDSDSDSDDDDDEDTPREIYFVPDDSNILQAVFTAIQECSALNPSPGDQSLDDDDSDEDTDDDSAEVSNEQFEDAEF